MQQAEGIKAPVEQGQGVIRRAVDELFGQLHFVVVIASEGTADQQMAGQLHLAHHPHLGKSGVAMLVAGRAIAFPVLRGIRRTPDYPIDAEQAQARPSGMVGGCVPTLLGQGKDLADSLAAQTLAPLDDGAGRYQRSLAGEHDVHATDYIPGRHATKQCQTDNAPEHGLQRQAPLAHGGHSRGLERCPDQLRIQ
ncbi:hypothetical protein D3C84_660300 [compost metagenome]